MIRVAMLGCGGMAQYHLKNILQQQETTQIAALCDPNPRALESSKALFRAAELPPPQVGHPWKQCWLLKLKI